MVAYKAGDRVKYHAVGGRSSGTDTSTTTGEIVDVLTEPQPAGETGVTAKASEDEPRYLIRNDNTGKETAYKGTNILGKC
ncbi:hypothetical protein AGABI1DRAFT_114897 [Agaricus bisporus var. burnettii JB137-S8]|uniref:Hypervirulence associated protein TUDOR domain-containing protein n=1 Tax=Agaricus bisporus var. burnettii (strain JB137-S8 / ATCC MYA-4627 / FGSC 10392) TaxID=597362 RepID=K5WRT2_AGABU|nr:hypothetical protein AGABI2DRAFT_191123 [Agaricus bisporus var. bisporus H97]XP_007331416.1 uncharacterized protein AGABI1DRAFT_114897 [Agaricus bisporus var. burnettii JB137-S8]EKM78071.1 hypothetical protein AGABI1DRAFT_114897 [Agaricus bisporus var. burnettii JB137-S8]EKV48969.1 hypothetical protein AGABI2DRAFT_191123 [Agaricus bisporus var. bisporus H97]